MKICIHAGHNPYGLPGSGAVGYLKESTENRRVCKILYKKLNDNPNIQAIDVTVNNGKNQKDILDKLNAEVNRINPDLSISIHLNAASTDSASGTECYIYSTRSEARIAADNIQKRISKFLKIPERGVKVNSFLSVLRNVRCPALLIECCFVTSLEDAKKWSAEKCAEAIYQGLMDTYDILKLGTGGNNSSETENTDSEPSPRFRMYISVSEGTEEELKPLALAFKKQGHEVMAERIG